VESGLLEPKKWRRSCNCNHCYRGPTATITNSPTTTPSSLPPRHDDGNEAHAPEVVGAFPPEEDACPINNVGQCTEGLGPSATTGSPLSGSLKKKGPLNTTRMHGRLTGLLREAFISLKTGNHVSSRCVENAFPALLSTRTE
jgi:hypothetical protein